MDLRAGYWHVKLDDESSNLTTFTTPYGRYKWLRLPFGTSVSAEIFAKRLYDCVQDLSGIVCIADDLMIYGVGRTDHEATRDHDLKLEKLLQRCREVGIRLNASKMILRQKSVTFLDHVITHDGLQSDPAKIEAIKEMPSPTDVTGVQRLKGLVNYLAKFLLGLSDVMEPIRQLTRKNVPWNWSNTQEKALEKMKILVSESPVLCFYDHAKEIYRSMRRHPDKPRRRRAARRGQGGRLTTLNFRPGAVTTLNLGHVFIFHQVIFSVPKQGSIESPSRNQRLENDAKEREKQTIVAKNKLVGLIMQAVIGAHCKKFTGSRAYVASFIR